MEGNSNQNIAKARRKDESRNRKGKLELIAVLIVLALLGGAMIYEFIWPHDVAPYAKKELIIILNYLMNLEQRLTNMMWNKNG